MHMKSISNDKSPERRSRFVRAPSPHIRLTDDDREIIRRVAQFRFLRSADIARLFLNRSPRKIIERLGNLYHAGYLDRPRAQLDYFASAGSAPIIYALGNSGALALAEFTDAPVLASDWTDKNREVKRPYIHHALLVAEIMIGFEVALRGRQDVSIVDENSLRSTLPERTRRANNPWTLSADLRHGATRHLIPASPDAVFALHFNDVGRQSYFYVEADRATMPISRSDIAQSSYRRRLLAYLTAHQAKLHTQRLGIDNLRVLTITTSAERIASMLAVVKEITKGRGSNMFLFTDIATLGAHGNPLTLPWLTTSGTVRLDVPPRAASIR